MTYVLKCILPAGRPHHASGVRHWFHAPRLVRPIAYAWHRHTVSKPVVHALTVAQGACRYVPMALGVAAGVTMAPGVAAPPFERPAPPVSAVSAPAGPVYGVGDVGQAFGFGPGIVPAAFTGLPESGPQGDVSPFVPASSVPLNVILPDGNGPGFLPRNPGVDRRPWHRPHRPHGSDGSKPPQTVSSPLPPQTGDGTPPPQQVPEAPSVALFLPVLALLALARRMVAPRG